jgi:hypothetical protein
VVLDPKSDEYLSLISMVYCGKSREDLLSSREAVEAQIKLQTVLKQTASKLLRNEGGSCPSPLEGKGTLPSKASSYLDGIKIKLADENDGCKPGEPSVSLMTSRPKRVSPSFQTPGSGISPLSVESALPPTPNPATGGAKPTDRVSPSCLKRSTSADSIKGQPLQEEESSWMWVGHKKLAEKVLPRQWHVLSCPLPEVPSVPQGLLASVKESMEESHFHESIYYSKKKVSLC